jgi:hypothetical protein
VTAEEFERQYAEHSGITVERLRELGRIVAPCACGDEACHGWQSTTAERLAEDRFELPDRCHYCRVFLVGGATVHKPGCQIRALIEEHFPDGTL